MPWEAADLSNPRIRRGPPQVDLPLRLSLVSSAQAIKRLELLTKSTAMSVTWSSKRPQQDSLRAHGA